jgi:hypothetical protein
LGELGLGGWDGMIAVVVWFPSFEFMEQQLAATPKSVQIVRLLAKN